MGFITTATTITLVAKLTPLGRQKLVSTNNSLISTFSFGDSDANYNTPLLLTSGQVPSPSGDLGTNQMASNSTADNIFLKSLLVVNPSGTLRKSVETDSSLITVETQSQGSITISGSSLSRNVINRNDSNTDSLVNLFYSFGLPLNANEDLLFTSIPLANGGFANTALSGIAQTQILVIGVDDSVYGEWLDGKTVKLVLPTTGGTYTIYSTFQSKGVALNVEDINTIETSTTTKNIGTNIAFLFSDDIMTPNGGSGSLSWSTGYGTVKPFSINGKQLYNLQTNSNIGVTADTAIGVAYLDKGFLVITNPQIIADYDSTTASATTLTVDSISTAVYQNITCIGARGEFGSSTNPTFTGNDSPRISEVGLYDNLGNLIAYAKTDRHVAKNINEFMALSVKISI